MAGLQANDAPKRPHLPYTIEKLTILFDCEYTNEYCRKEMEVVVRENPRDWPIGSDWVISHPNDWSANKQGRVTSIQSRMCISHLHRLTRYTFTWYSMVSRMLHSIPVLGIWRGDLVQLAQDVSSSGALAQFLLVGSDGLEKLLLLLLVSELQCLLDHVVGELRWQRPSTDTLSWRSSRRLGEVAISLTISPRTAGLAQVRIFSMTLELYFCRESSETLPRTQRVIRSDSLGSPFSMRY